MRSVAFLALLFMCFSARCQENIGFTQTSFQSSSVVLGDTIFFTTYLKNYDNNAFNDSIAFKLSVNGVLVTNTDLFPNPFAGQLVNIPGSDSIPASFIIIASPLYFLAGPNGLVVWPVVDSAGQVHDSIMKQVQVLTTGISEPAVERINAFINGNNLVITGNSLTEQGCKLKVFNAIGQQMFGTTGMLPVKIPLNGWAAGIYLVEANFANGKQYVVKIRSP